jgi:hypothetical protein
VPGTQLRPRQPGADHPVAAGGSARSRIASTGQSRTARRTRGCSSSRQVRRPGQWSESRLRMRTWENGNVNLAECALGRDHSAVTFQNSDMRFSMAQSRDSAPPRRSSRRRALPTSPCRRSWTGPGSRCAASTSTLTASMSCWWRCSRTPCCAPPTRSGPRPRARRTRWMHSRSPSSCCSSCPGRTPRPSARCSPTSRALDERAQGAGTPRAVGHRDAHPCRCGYAAQLMDGCYPVRHVVEQVGRQHVTGPPPHHARSRRPRPPH